MKKYLFILLFPLVGIQTSQAQEMEKTQNIEKATFGAGCFWCVEAIYELVEGVVHVESGYSGGHIETLRIDKLLPGKPVMLKLPDYILILR